MKKTTKPGGGFEIPRSARPDDLLGRWQFAREIALIATSTPAEWSARIGIYGEWGFGKTTVLNYIEGIAASDGHLVIRFEPWQHESRFEMWSAFTSAVDKALEASGIITVDQKKRKAFTQLSGLARYLLTLARFAGLQSNAEAALEELASWRARHLEIFDNISKRLDNKHIIVLIDDMDRASPRIVPQLLYSLKEILNIPRFIFVLAFDPAKVGKSLEQTHPEWGGGTEFLEKIVEFPRWLPVPTRRQVLALLEVDRQEWCSFIPPEVLEVIADLLPPNPRSVKRFLRHIWSLKSAILRYDPDEFSWRTLVLTLLLKSECPGFANLLFSSPDYVKEIFGYHPRVTGKRLPSGTMEVEDDLERRTSAIEKLASRTITDENELLLAKEIIARLTMRSVMGYRTEDIETHAYLTERPPAVTKKEFMEAFAAWRPNPSAEAVWMWLKAHSSQHLDGENDILRGLFLEVSRQIRRSMVAAIHTHSDDSLKQYADEASEAIKLARMIALDLHGFAGHSPILGAPELNEYLTCFGGFLRFESHPALREVADLGLECLLDIVMTITADMTEYLELFRPWYADATPKGHQVERHDAYDAVIAVLLSKMAESFQRRYAVDGWAESLFLEKNRAERFVFLNSKGPLWGNQQSRNSFLEFLANSTQNPALRENSVNLLLYLPHEAERGSVPGRQIVKEFMNDSQIMGALWKSATSLPLNPRVFGQLEEAAKKIEDMGGRPPETPTHE